jgi:hypothetical protein
MTRPSLHTGEGAAAVADGTAAEAIMAHRFYHRANIDARKINL